jgi:hypothetical protein
MVGTAAAFNFQAHTAFATVDAVAARLHAIIPIHWVLHAVSGAAYLHALLVFPTGRVVPPRLVWLVRLAYVFMLEEIALTFVTGSVGLVAVPFQLLFGFRGSTPEVLGKLMDSDALFVVIFFGVLLPLAGAFAVPHDTCRRSSSSDQACGDVPCAGGAGRRRTRAASGHGCSGTRASVNLRHDCALAPGAQPCPGPVAARKAFLANR